MDVTSTPANYVTANQSLPGRLAGEGRDAESEAPTFRSFQGQTEGQRWPLATWTVIVHITPVLRLHVTYHNSQ